MDDKSVQFVRDSAPFSPAQKEAMREEIVRLVVRTQGYEQEIRDKMTQFSESKLILIRKGQWMLSRQ
ncbi:MAG: hypothetical protein BGO54_05880 [Sphingobacteriales bacterium 46-32]|nr:MAG: hypothetical protein BGO54_05880 [Sphingobacteriales bacterium 46-32]